MKRVLLASVFSVGLVATAQAHHHHHHHYRHHVHEVRASNFASGLGYGLIHMLKSAEINRARPNDCFGIQWCGCWLRHHFGISDTSLNLARNWASWGHNAMGPGPGVVAVWNHHVGVISSGPPWMVTSGNFNGGVATVPLERAGRGSIIAYRTE